MTVKQPEAELAPPNDEQPGRGLIKIWITGVVQGVGFRPFVYRLAHDHGLAGWVRNTSAGVEIEAEGAEAALARFLDGLESEAPPLAHIESVRVEHAAPAGYHDFVIRHSQAQEGGYQLVSPDIATCPECLRELLDPHDRRYHYPFTNCTNCGPRFTIIQDIPYDRPKTTMAAFTMCPECQAEYDDPMDRRFHAQPNACPACGPELTLADRRGEPQQVPDVLREAARLLLAGKVLAIKGLGGFHLACDATNPEAVSLLRQRKRRPHKPLAVMIATAEEIEQHCTVTPDEEALLTSPQCPIVLLPWREDSTVCREVAPGYDYLGVMLPYTPLHHILLREVGRPLVMTSGNLSEEPIAENNDEALRRLGDLADAFVLHNREIYSRYDDSVWFVPESGPQPVRRSRGYAPFPIRLPFDLPAVLAAGPELKNTFCLTRDNYAFLSQHIGDMENLETLEYYQETIALYERLFRISPKVIAHDLHPEYLSTKYAQELLANDASLRGQGVQHHFAHIVSCMADNGLPADHGPIIGVALDGTGYGTDGAIWGGEFLVADYTSWRRAGHLEYLPLAGGEAAIRNPYRLALAYSHVLTGEVPDVPALRDIPPQEVAVIRHQVERGINAPLTSSCGRLFDAVAALLGIRGRVSYEAQAAIEMETMARRAALDPDGDEAYPFGLQAKTGPSVVRLGDTWRGILEDIRRGADVGAIAWRFHKTVAAIVLETCKRLRSEFGVETVALSGGCFQNRLLLELCLSALTDAGFLVLTHHQVPCNDGGVALGQAVAAGLSARADGQPE